MSNTKLEEDDGMGFVDAEFDDVGAEGGGEIHGSEMDDLHAFAEGSGDEDNDWNMSFLNLIEDSNSYEQNYLGPLREENALYYEGYVPDVDGLNPRDFTTPSYDPDGDSDDYDDRDQSTFVSTDVKDTIMGMLPSLVRIFSTTHDAVYFIPASEEQEPMAEQCRDYLNHVFWRENEGFLILYSVIKDALMLRSGIVTWWTEDNTDVFERVYRNISIEQIMMLLAEDPTMEIVDAEFLTPTPEFAAVYQTLNSATVFKSVAIRHSKSKPRHRVEAVPPEEFRISPGAKSVCSSPLVGRVRYRTVSELRKANIPDEYLENADAAMDIGTEEQFLRDPGIEIVQDDDSILYGEWYVRVDVDGDGIDEMRYIRTVGSNYTVVSNQMCENAPFALFTPDPTPHAAIGDSISDSVKDIQRVKTNILRRVLDNLANAVIARSAINETTVNLEDALNTDQSGVVRVRGNPSQSIFPLTTPFVGKDAMPMADYFDTVRAARTGITEASKGLDPDAMQSTAMVGINAILAGAQERIELVARVLAETGFKTMYVGLLREIVNSPNHAKTIKMRGGWTDINPSLYDPDMTCEVNPMLGKGTDTVRMQALMHVAETQAAIIEKYGIKNPMVGPIEFRNTHEDLLRFANIKNTTRYFREVTPEAQKAMMEAPEEPSPAVVVAQAELEKVKQRAVEKLAELRDKREFADMEDAFKRDKLIVEAIVDLVTAKNPRDDKENDIKKVGVSPSAG